MLARAKQCIAYVVYFTVGATRGVGGMWVPRWSWIDDWIFGPVE